MRKLLVLIICLAFPATASAHQHHKHHHKHHQKAHKATVETPECWETADWTMECNAAEEAELQRVESEETPQPVEEVKAMTPAEEAEWSGLPEE